MPNIKKCRDQCQNLMKVHGPMTHLNHHRSYLLKFPHLSFTYIVFKTYEKLKEAVATLK
jgi:hypothetical protein